MMRLVLGTAVAVAVAFAACGGKRQDNAPRSAAAEGKACTTKSARELGSTALQPGARAVTVGGRWVWVANPLTGTVDQVDGAGGHPIRRFGSLAAPVSITATAGRAWVAARDADRVYALDPRNGRKSVLMSVGVPVAVNAVGPDVWVLSLDDGSLYAADAKTATTTVFDLGVPELAPARMAPLGRDLWVLGQGDTSVVALNTNLRRATVGSVKLTANSTSDIATGDGGVWVADPKDFSVLRVDPGTKAVRAFRAAKPFRPTALAVGACGLWAVDATGHVARFDTRTLRMVGRALRIGRSGGDITDDGAGGVWVTDPSAGRLVHVGAQ